MPKIIKFCRFIYYKQKYKVASFDLVQSVHYEPNKDSCLFFGVDCQDYDIRTDMFRRLVYFVDTTYLALCAVWCGDHFCFGFEVTHLLLRKQFLADLTY